MQSNKNPDCRTRKVDETLEETNNEYHYRSVIGVLMYLMTGTRPDLAFAVGVASRNLEENGHSSSQKNHKISKGHH